MDDYPYTRRSFIGGLAATAALQTMIASGQPAPPATADKRKIKVGVVGCGGRGSFIADLFHQHGGYEVHALADYFQDVADRCGDLLGVDKMRRFSGLSGYEKLIASGVEAVVLQTPPYFFPQHSAAAVAAGLHVYLAKPVAVDVPGCLTIEALGKQASEKNQLVFVDFQMSTDPINIEVARRIREGALGKVAQIQTFGTGSGVGDPPLGANIEGRLQNLTWLNDIALGGDYIVNYDIHSIDAALWVLDERPESASGASRIMRADPHGDAHDVCSVIYRYPSGVVHNHYGQGLNNKFTKDDECLLTVISGQVAYAQVNYIGKAFINGGAQAFAGGAVSNLYLDGANRNIASFYDRIVGGDFTNSTIRRSVDSCLACILGREAARRNGTLTMAELIQENRKLTVNLEGLKA